jgi:hypothetical protein
MLKYWTVLQHRLFRDSSNGIEEYTTTVTGFINKCIDDIAPKSDHTYIQQPEDMNYRPHLHCAKG